MQSSQFKIDSTLFWSVAILVALGILMVYSASSIKAAEQFDDSRFFLKSHAAKALFGLVVMLIVSRVNYRFWLRISPVLIILSLSLLIYLVTAPGVEAIRGSKRWFALGPLHFQPSDLARLAVVLFLSATTGGILFKNFSSRSQFIFCLAGLIAILIPIALQPDLGTALLAACVGAGIIFVAGQKLGYLIPLALTAVPAGLMVL
ncbi:FtsW/RodA/SpoVE family cell cycle protein, partial [bacterium]|nr:FtsW/RodA/SpoVE family cell cycle protein [bacterium]